MKIKLIPLLLLFIICSSCVNYLSDPALDKEYKKAVSDENWEDALKCVSEKIKRNASDTILYYEKARLTSLVYPNQFEEEIISNLTIVLEQQNEFTEARLLKFQKLLEIKKYDKAIEEIELIESYLGITKLSLLHKAGSHFQNKNFKDAAFLYDDLLKYRLTKQMRKFIYYQNIYSKYLSGNKIGASWDTAFLEKRGFPSDSLLMDKIHREKLAFDDVPKIEFNNNIEEFKSLSDKPLGLEYDRIYNPIYRSKLYRSSKTTVKELSNLEKNIEVLDLSYLKLHKLPDVVSTFKNLKAIDLSGNDFYDYNEVFEQLSSLPQLEYLEINRCNLREVPSSIKKLNSLKGLSISSTNIKKLPPEIIHLSELSYLNLRSIPRLYELPKEISYLKKLNVLNVSGGGMKNLRNELSTCYQLNAIVGNASRITKIPKDIGNLKHLKWINLAACRINTLPESIGEITYLSNLSLGSNELCVLPKSIAQLENLETLSLDFNRFKDFPKSVLKNKNLRSLWVHNNNFKEIPIEVTNLKKLTHLLVDHQIIAQDNIDLIKEKRPDINVVKHDSQRYVRGKRRKTPCN